MSTVLKRVILTLALLVLTGGTAFAGALCDPVAVVYQTASGQLFHLEYNSLLKRALWYGPFWIDLEKDGFSGQREECRVPPQSNPIWPHLSLFAQTLVILNVAARVFVLFLPMVSWWLLARHSRKIWRTLGWALAVIAYLLWLRNFLPYFF